ncbi:hypothetical protein QP943_07465 [Corynebacterium kefirresidentii]|uniref:hypothetical protein n=1 Tax=Corynebacterium TaxID=1716 RepID=UPI0003B7EA4F|nr:MULTISPECIES: hypothetical protein [Corynebacterium]WKS54447.1 hypothetical protein NLL48_04715 [Corynebacterium tuberculostearicum]ERS48937.1 hypothetical protein HMPREF1282_00894 [Corynebacterium sp. KPL1856]ERS49466.1 hypothetical protein HMPREF1286_00911 [Corynebacterium sp. KPL1860]ERS54145.1 hypothetical protein HMPREF1264_01756 [Corynebacterium sp. KPL1821]ERS60359.1 hypothetical protein HMPREF1260_01455 [Corynebacterium sp. KPL1817]
MSTRAIVPVKLSLTEGDFYTLWAPKWRQNGSEWQAFLGDDEDVLAFNSPAELLCFVESGTKHDLLDHPQWDQFAGRDADRVTPAERHEYDLIGMPEALAGRPSHQNVSTVARNLEIASALADVAGAEHTTIFFASHSILRNVSRGADHYSGEQGMSEWSGVGHVIAGNWKGVIEDLDQHVRVVSTDDFDAAKVSDAKERISSAAAASAAAAKEAEEKRKAAAEAADPYDNSPWAAAGIDPIKITAQSKSVYTLRTYLDGKPIFLGKWGEIFTFDSPKTLVRWIMDNDDHDLARVSTWEEVVSAANAGELEVQVHPDNQYSFNGIVRDIEKGPEAVDSDQMARCYEVCADAADWAGDDSINSYMLANPRLQDYLGYMLGSTEHAGYVPSKPYTEHAESWKGLEDMLIKRFSKF